MYPKLVNYFLILFFLIFSNHLYANKNNTEIKIAYYEDYAPYSFMENGELKGIFIDISSLVIKKMMKYKLIQDAFPWERAQELVKKGEFNAHITVKTPKREEILNFQKGNTIASNVAIVFSKDNEFRKEKENIKSLDDLKKYEIIAYIGQDWLKSALKNESDFNIKKLSNLENALKMINFNRVDLHLSPNSQIVKYQVRKLKLDNLIVRNVEFIEPAIVEFKLGILKTIDKNAEIINEFEKNLEIAKKNGKIEEIVSKYLGKNK